MSSFPPVKKRRPREAGNRTTKTSRRKPSFRGQVIRVNVKWTSYLSAGTHFLLPDKVAFVCNNSVGHYGSGN